MCVYTSAYCKLIAGSICKMLVFMKKSVTFFVAVNVHTDNKVLAWR